VRDGARTGQVGHGGGVRRRGGRAWQVCPVADGGLYGVNGEGGRAGEHLVVVGGKPEQTLFIVERTE